MTNFVILAVLLFNLFVAQSAQQTPPTPKLTMRLLMIPSESTSWPDFQVTFENTGDGDTILNLGFMIANGLRVQGYGNATRSGQPGRSEPLCG